MAIWDFRPRGDVLTGVAVGVSALAAPVVVPLAWSAVRPLVKAIFKGGFLLYETGRGAIAEATEWVGSEKPRTDVPMKVIEAKEPTKAIAQEQKVLEHRAEEAEGLGEKEAPPKPSYPKPKRQSKTSKKKPEKRK
jgi:hypothetical protein